MLKEKLGAILKKINKILMQLNENQLFEPICILLYKIIFDFSYMVLMQGDATEAYKLNFNIYKFIFGYFIIIGMYFIINKINGNLSRSIIKIFFCLMFIPITTMYAGKNYLTTNYLLILIEFLIIILTIIILEELFKKNKKNHIRVENKKFLMVTSNIIYYAFLINTIIVIFACFYYNGLPSLEAINISNVYEVREQFYLPKILNYLYNFEVKFILTFLIILYLHKKKYIQLSLMILALLILYLYKGDKITLLSLPLAIGVYYIFKLYSKYKVDKFIPCIFTVIVTISSIMYNIVRMIFSVFVRRLLIVPANLKFIYLDFFSKNPKIGIVGTIFNAIVKMQDPYANMPYQNLMAGIYIGSYEMYSNTGFLAEGYARFGYIGIIIIPIIFGIILSIINNSANKNGISFMMAIAALPFLNLNDSFLLPSLTFGGILLLIIVSIFFDANYVCQNDKRNNLKQIADATEINKEEKL